MTLACGGDGFTCDHQYSLKGCLPVRLIAYPLHHTEHASEPCDMYLHTPTEKGPGVTLGVFTVTSKGHGFL